MRSLKTIRNQQVVGSSPTAGSRQVSNLQQTLYGEIAGVSHRVSHRAPDVLHEAVPLALVILTLLFLWWR